jgi:hypothetical protein
MAQCSLCSLDRWLIAPEPVSTRRKITSPGLEEQTPILRSFNSKIILTEPRCPEEDGVSSSGMVKVKVVGTLYIVVFRKV